MAVPDLHHRACTAVLLLLGAVLFGSGATLECPDGYSGWSDNCYKFVNKPENFSTAQADCAQSGGNLVSIHNFAEDTHVKAGMESVGVTNLVTGYFWIGLHNVSLTFSWVDGSDVVYTKWGKGQPDNWKGGEQCAVGGVIKDSLPTWSAISCLTPSEYACKAPPPTNITSTDLPTTTESEPTTTEPFPMPLPLRAIIAISVIIIALGFALLLVTAILIRYCYRKYRARKVVSQYRLKVPPSTHPAPFVGDRKFGHLEYMHHGGYINY